MTRNSNVLSRVLLAAAILLLLLSIAGCEGVLGGMLGDDDHAETSPESETEGEAEGETGQTGGAVEAVETEGDPQGMVEELLHAVNSYRQENSLPPLVFHETVEEAAQNHTNHMVDIQELTYDSQYSDAMFIMDLRSVYGIEASFLAGETGHGFTDGYSLFDTMVSYMSDTFLNADATHHAAAKAYGVHERDNGGYTSGYYLTYILIASTEGSEEG